MTRLSTATQHGKKRVPQIHKQRRPSSRLRMQSDDEWRRKPSMAAYYRPKQRGVIDLDMDDEQDMNMDAAHEP